MWIQSSPSDTWHYSSNEDRYRPLCGIQLKVTSSWTEQAEEPTQQPPTVCVECRYKAYIYQLERAIDKILEDCSNAKRRAWRSRLCFDQLNVLNWFQVEAEFGKEIKDHLRRLFDKTQIFDPKLVARQRVEDSRIKNAREQEEAVERWRRENLQIQNRNTRYSPKIDGRKRNYPRSDYDDYSEESDP